MLEPEYKCTEIQIDLTDRCNAACLFCARNDPNNVINTNDITLNDIKKIMKSNVKSMTFCGDLGDATSNRYLFEIVEYLVSVNCKIKLMTNGAAHSTKYWERLASVIGDNPVIFDLDGNTKETHERYRVNCPWEKVLENAQAFINAGGWAVWQMILFPWNEHEVEGAKLRAKDMNFKNFRLIYSQRNTSYGVGTHEMGSEDFSEIEPICVTKKRLYISANGNIAPCCWIANKYQLNNSISDLNIRNFESLNDLLFSEQWKIYWKNMSQFNDPKCIMKCGKKRRDYKEITNFTDKIFTETYDDPSVKKL